MDEKQLSEFLAEVDAELKARRLAYVKARRGITKSFESRKDGRILRRLAFETTIQFDPVASAMLRLAELQCEKFTATDDDHKGLFEAMLNAFMLGQMREILENKSEHLMRASKATNGRRLIGATSRAKVAKAAESFMHLSKEKAAALMADTVHLDPGTIRRYLSELYPGDKWKQ